MQGIQSSLRSSVIRRSHHFATHRLASTTPIVELREYILSPEHATTYLKYTGDAVDLRKSLSPLRFFSLPETGGQLMVATHAYYYAGGVTERHERRSKMAQNDDWKNYLASCRPCVSTQSSLLYVEAPLVREMEGVQGLAELPAMPSVKPGILEFRRYQLQLGYETVPRFLDSYGKGLPSKLAAPGTDPSTTLLTLLYSEVGYLNEVIEIWRHDGPAAMEVSRQAARGAAEWRAAIAEIAPLAQSFRSTIHVPTAFSPIR